MTRHEVTAWLEARRPAPPAALLEHLEALVSDSDERLPEHLAELGAAVLTRVVGGAGGGGGRELALDLLAADAFVTYAFEAQAEADVGGLVRLAQQVAGTRA